MTDAAALRRELGVFGATMLGMGAMIGTGVFVSIGLAAGIAGPSAILAIALAAVVATFNALSSAQLAASRPVSGGTYEYGYAYLHPALGFTAGWMFLCAKTASAATAALGFAGYLVQAIGLDGWIVPVALVTTATLTAIAAAGIRQSHLTNVVIVSITVLSLLFFIVTGALAPGAGDAARWQPFFAPAEGGVAAALLHATALMFVAYTGYARIATLGEEVKEPRVTIPRAIVITLLVTAALYVATGAVGIATIGAPALAEAARTTAAPLEAAARQFGGSGAAFVVAVGAMAAMLGVSLNLILGLSRMLLAMGRRGDAPAVLAHVTGTGSPAPAVATVGAAVAALALLGDVATTWSFSAFTVLIYYAITNLAALRLPRAQRLYPPILAWCGLASCLALAFFVEREIWLAGLALLAAGLAWHLVARRIRRSADPHG